jgi:DNA-binding NtrC family response regulator
MYVSRAKILYIDDEPDALKYFKLNFEDKYPILTAKNAKEGYELFTKKWHQIGIIMADQRMPDETGLELLIKARNFKPEIRRILITAYADHDVAVKAVNDGQISYYIEKPFDLNKLGAILDEGLVKWAEIDDPDERKFQKFITRLRKGGIKKWVKELPFKKAKRNVVDIFEDYYVTRILAMHKGNMSKAARTAGIGRATIYRVLGKMGKVDREKEIAKATAKENAKSKKK